jgi:hypothetical protein
VHIVAGAELLQQACEIIVMMIHVTFLLNF